MVEDVVRSLGLLCLGSRFRRIGERLQADTQKIIELSGLAVQAAHYPLLAALDRGGPLTVGELAQAVGVTQPGVTRSVGQLVEAGYVEIGPAADDLRRRLVSLSPRGQELVDHSKRCVWPQVERAVADLCGDRAATLLEQLAAIEDGLADASLLSRAKREARRA